MRIQTLALIAAPLHSKSLFRHLAIAIAIAWSLLGTSIYADPIYSVSIGGGSSVSGSTTVSETVGSILPIPGKDTNGFEQAIAGPNDLGVYANVTAAEGSAGQIAAISADVFAELQDSLVLASAPTTGILAVNVDVAGLSLAYGYGFGEPEADISLSAVSGAGNSCVALDSNPADQSHVCGLLGEGTNALQVPYVLQGGGTVPFSLTFEAVDVCEAEYIGGIVGSCLAAANTSTLPR